MEGQASHVVSNYTETEEQENGSGEVHYCPAEMILLAPYSAFSETITVVVVGAGAPHYNLGRWKLRIPIQFGRNRLGQRPSSFCSVRLGQSSYYIKVFCLARLSLSWSFD